MIIIRSKAPLRISFGGGGTDVPPYPQEKGGAVISTTINKYAYANIIPKHDDKNEISVESLDYDITVKYDISREIRYDGELDLVKAVVNHMKPHMPENSSLRLFIHSDAPPGSGLGSSSTMAVALIGAFKEWLRLPLTNYDIAEAAYQIERVDLGIKGGLQDQYAATFGGFNYIEFLGDKVIVNPLRLSKETINELQYHLLLYYTGETRLSANILEDQTKSYIQKKKEVTEALDRTKELAIKMKNALLRDDIYEFGRLLDDAWKHKKKFSKKISNPLIDKMYETAKKYGAIGGKISGAGGGGYMTLFCEVEKKHIVAEKLEKIGGKVIDFGFDYDGLQTWTITRNEVLK